MSWSVEFIAKRSVVGVVIEERLGQSRYGAPLQTRNALHEMVQATGAEPDDLILVKSSGHTGTGGCNSQSEVRPLKVVEPELQQQAAEAEAFDKPAQGDVGAQGPGGVTGKV